MKMLSRKNFNTLLTKVVGKKILIVSNDSFNDLINFAKESKYKLNENLLESKKFPMALCVCKCLDSDENESFSIKRFSSSDNLIDSYNYVWVIQSNSYYKEILNEPSVDKTCKKEDANLSEISTEELLNELSKRKENTINNINNELELLKKLGYMIKKNNMPIYKVYLSELTSYEDDLLIAENIYINKENDIR